jgi:hypothetical protein
MKNAISISFGLILCTVISIGCSSNKKLVNHYNIGLTSIEPLEDQERVDGDKLIETLFAQRFNFNKTLIKYGFDPKKQLPKSISIINSAPTSTISFNGFDYLIKQNKVVAVKGIKLSPSALVVITEKVVKLDQIQQYCSAQVNLAYQQRNRDLNTIKELDRQYFTTLRTIKLVTSNIAGLAKKPNASVSIEMSVAKIKLPDLKVIGMKTENKGGYVAEIE